MAAADHQPLLVGSQLDQRLPHAPVVIVQEPSMDLEGTVVKSRRIPPPWGPPTLHPLTMSSREPSKMLLPPCERSVSTVSWNFLSCGQGGKGHTCYELFPGLSPIYLLLPQNWYLDEDAAVNRVVIPRHGLRLAQVPRGTVVTPVDEAKPGYGEGDGGLWGPQQACGPAPTCAPGSAAHWSRCRSGHLSAASSQSG